MQMRDINPSMGASEWGMLVLLSVIWGGSFFFFAVAVTALPTFTIVFARVALGAVVLWLIALALREPLPRSLRQWRRFAVMGLLNNAIPFTLIVWGQREIASGLAAVLNATTPFFTVIVANALTRDEKLTANRLAGACVGLIGVAAMLGVDFLSSFGGTLLPQLAVLAAAVTYAFASVYGRRFADTSPLITAAGQTTASSLMILPLMLLIDRPWTLAPPPSAVWLSLLGLAVVCTAFAYVLFFTILKRAGATNIMLVTFLVPVSAMALGVAFLGEVVETRQIAGMAAIGAGLALIDGRPLAFLKRRGAA